MKVKVPIPLHVDTCAAAALPAGPSKFSAVLYSAVLYSVYTHPNHQLAMPWHMPGGQPQPYAA
jgi:hypothetical protein